MSGPWEENEMERTCDLEKFLPHEKLITCENWRPLPTAEKPRYAVGVSVLLTNQGQLLLGRRKNNKAAGWLGTPGGRLEPNESIMECARREFYEETGAHLVQGVDLGTNQATPRIFNVLRHNRFDDNYVMIYVHATAWEGIIDNPEPEKCEGWSWYSGYDLEGEKNITEPEEILKYLPLNRVRPITAIDQAHIDGWNAALVHLVKEDRIYKWTADMYHK
jgi:8-oxo-dGTP diphosphatase